MISPALRELIDNRKLSFGDWSTRFDGNGPVRQIDKSLAPPPPLEETRINSSGRAVTTQPILELPRLKPGCAVGTHPFRIKDAPPCPHCGSNNTWSRAKSKSGKRRRVCKEQNCGKGYTFA